MVQVSLQNLAVVYHTDHISSHIWLPRGSLFLKHVVLTIVAVPLALTILPSSVLVAGSRHSVFHFLEPATVTLSN